LDGVNLGRVQGKEPLDPNTVGRFTDGKRPPPPTPLDGNDNPLKGLHTLSVPLDNTNLDPHGISRAKFRDVLPHECFFNMS
jgi:hypothetical protein